MFVPLSRGRAHLHLRDARKSPLPWKRPRHTGETRNPQGIDNHEGRAFHFARLEKINAPHAARHRQPNVRHPMDDEYSASRAYLQAIRGVCPPSSGRFRSNLTLAWAISAYQRGCAAVPLPRKESAKLGIIIDIDSWVFAFNRIEHIPDLSGSVFNLLPVLQASS
ncbi:hypothetical protein CCHOA_10240 [Corynebacterium choanae]|uniref:Uncharacterized protein n=1 Tax=Corynebacterium choanae TaxID=1862358 RepID=A0A3G6J8K0_9CORY|nr:hypothetical protein CCHOA_10240 [Corynebacterium choanae]